MYIPMPINLNCPFYIVGGAVRDIILGEKPQDIDLVALTTPEVLDSVGLKRADAKSCIPVWLCKVDGVKVEVALPRKEVKVGRGYKGFVFETENVSLLEDLKRRDFTINAMAMSPDGQLIDPYGGEKDLREGIIRHVDSSTFVEDPLRVIRACRFTAKGFRIHPETLGLMKSITREEFESLPVERFSAELMKAMQEPQPEMFFITLAEVPHACEVFLPELMAMRNIPAGPLQFHPEGDLFVHTMQVISRAKTTEGRLAGFFHDIGKILTPRGIYPHHYDHDKLGAQLAEEIARRLKLSSRLVKVIRLVINVHDVITKVKMSKLLAIAEIVVRVDAVDAVLDVVKADRPGVDLSTVKKAFDVVSIPARKLGVSLEGNPTAIRERIRQRRMYLMSV